MVMTNTKKILTIFLTCHKRIEKTRRGHSRWFRASVNIPIFSEIGRLKDDNVLVLPLDIVNFDEQKEAVNRVLSQFKQVGTCNVILHTTILN